MEKFKINYCEYVCGFLFSNDFNRVVLIKKKRPDWQKGYLNGVGGKVHFNESCLDGMIREFQEETGLLIKNWLEFSSIECVNYTVHFYWSTCDNINNVKTMTDEEIFIIDTSELQQLKIVNSLSWLIPLIFDRNVKYAHVLTHK